MRVERLITSIFGEGPEGMHRARWRAFRSCVQGLIGGRRLSVTGLGRGETSKVAPKHCIKRADRLVGNPRLAAERGTVYRHLAQQLLQNSQQPVVLVDWSVLPGGMRYCLSAAVPIGGRALPIYCEVHARSKVGNRTVERAFLHGLQAVLKGICTPVIVTDAGFRNPWFREVVKLGWHYLGRLTGYVTVCDQRGTLRCKADQLPARRRARDYGVCDVGQDEYQSTHRVVVAKAPVGIPHHHRPLFSNKTTSIRQYRKCARDPWVIATSLRETPPTQVVALYKTRMQIEQSFRDVKNPRWGWSLAFAKSRSNSRFATLLLIAAVATVVVTLVGLNAEQNQRHHRYQANTIRKRRVMSLFVLGNAVVYRNEHRTIRAKELRRTLSRLRQLPVSLE
jgi:hypothetical protein